mgnify:CR=1 FL=1
MTDYTDEQIEKWDKEDAMPWVIGLTDEELKQLKYQKKQLTSCGKQKIREKMNKIPENDEIEDILNIKLTEEKKEELDKMRLIDRFNEYLNQECAAMPHGSFISVEHFEAATLRATLYAFARKYNLKESIPVEELNNLADLIETQGNNYLEKVRQCCGPK